MIYISRFIFELTTPMHFGGGEGDGLLDAPVSRDAFGLWRISGSALAGIFRSHIKHSFGNNAEKNLFGTSHGDANMGSRVWCSDAVLLDFDDLPAWQKLTEGKNTTITAPSFVRDHVCIDLQTGSAKNSGKYDMEYVPAGTRFAFELSLDGWQEPLTESLVQYFAHLLMEIKASTFTFGGKSTNGYGQYNVLSLQCRNFNLQSHEGLTQWLQLEYGTTFQQNCGIEWEPSSINELANPKHNQKPQLSGSIDIPLTAFGPILIGGGTSNTHNDADICFATTVFCNYEKQQYAEHYTLPGSSIKGILRHRVYSIAKSLNLDADNIVNNIFGYITSEQSKNMQNAKGQRGKLIISDAKLSHVNHSTTVPHVAIDRFTGGAIDGHLFSEARLWDSDITLTLQIRIHNLDDLESALVLHTLMDLAQGKISIGSGGNRGNGRFKLNTLIPLRFNLSRQGENCTESNPAPLQIWLAHISTALQNANITTTNQEGATC